ncbi:MAG TPA: carboxylating nicotinate-nucleotide diphosphorylase [Acidimicrobiales bacterium]|nr:carboxylating nicotinate-nucleotide diphosphorylase [Acidimicrobiales bacterium]
MESWSDNDPPLAAIRPIVALALAEDILPLGDLTVSLLDRGQMGIAHFVSRRPGVLAGLATVAEVFYQVDRELTLTLDRRDGDEVAAREKFATVSGPFGSLLSAERTALNFLCHLSGIATMTRRYVEIVRMTNPNARVWDTRKTTPGMRSLEKAAVRAGGAVNHRGNLSDGILIKDNHLGGVGITEGVARALARWPGRMVEVECDRLEQVHEAVAAGASLVMCDNMTPDEVAKAVEIVHSHPRGAASACLVEASGGVTIDNIELFARAGADLISSGALTHSAPILDIGLDLEL